MLKISLWLLSPYWLQLSLVIQERVNHSPNLFLFRRGIPLSLRDAHLDEQIFLVQVYNELPRHRKVQNLYDDRRKQAGNTLIFFDQTISGICSNFLTRKLKLRSLFIDEISGFLRSFSRNSIRKRSNFISFSFSETQLSSCLSFNFVIFSVTQ